MKKISLELYCPTEDDWLPQFEQQAKRVERLMRSGYEVNINVIADGTRGAVYRMPIEKYVTK